MKEIIRNTFEVLGPGEQQKLRKLIFLDVLISILDIAFLAFLVFFIHFYTLPGKESQLDFLPNWFTKNKSLLPIAIFLFLFSLKNLAGYSVSRAQYRFVYHVAAGISEQNLKKYLQGPYVNYVETDSSIHIRQISQEPVEFAHYVLSGILQIISNAIIIALTVTAILIFNAKLFLLLVVFLLPAVILLGWIVKRKLKLARLHAKTASEKSLQHLQEALSGWVESNVYKKQDFFSRRYSIYQQGLNRYLSDIVVSQAMPQRLIEIFALLGFFILLVVNYWWSDEQAISVLTIGAFLAAAYKVIPGVIKILNLSSQVRTYAFTLSNILSRKRPTILERKKGLPGTLKSIEFINVSFNFEGRKILRDFNLRLQSGESLGISGISGIGKTTVLNLLLGFLEPARGEILINGVASNASQRQVYWERISYVKQQTFLVHDSLLKNIILDDGDHDPGKLDEALLHSGLNEFINSFPEGVHKLIAENGKNISGGQRQRIALARAWYKDADLLVLDEPFNEMDEQSETGILESLKVFLQNRKMVILITHDMESLSYCDKIISLDEA